jgi:hypothetical protein
MRQEIAPHLRVGSSGTELSFLSHHLDPTLAALEGRPERIGLAPNVGPGPELRLDAVQLIIRFLVLSSC